MPRKIYIALKSIEKVMPNVIIGGQDATAECGIKYYEDDVGYYYLQGELECNAE